MAAGFNDIDRRCDQYLAWIDDQRAQQLLVNQSLTAISGALGGILGVAAPESLAIFYTTTALGLGGSLYNAYQNRALLGIESSTIKTIVIERRLAFRTEFTNNPPSTRPDTVYVLRSYLRICTPQEITLDINTYTRDAILGNTPKRNNLAAQTRAAIAGQPRAPKPSDPIGTSPERSPRPEIYPGFTFPGPGREGMVAVQKALCVEPTNGKFGPKTKQGIGIYEAAYPDKSTKHGEIDSAEYEDLKNRPCDSGLYRNVYESREYATDSTKREAFVELLNEVSAADPLDTKISFGDASFRARVGVHRLILLSAQDDLGSHITPGLVLEMKKARDKKRLAEEAERADGSN